MTPRQGLRAVDIFTRIRKRLQATQPTVLHFSAQADTMLATRNGYRYRPLPSLPPLWRCSTSHGCHEGVERQPLGRTQASIIPSSQAGLWMPNTGEIIPSKRIMPIGILLDTPGCDNELGRHRLFTRPFAQHILTFRLSITGERRPHLSLSLLSHSTRSSVP
jgi:hypothetical protein